MERMDTVEKLREKTGVTYEHARDALERTDWDMLEAVVLLEKEGKIGQLKEEPKVEQAQQANRAQQKAHTGENASRALETVGNAIGGLVEKGNRKHLEVTKDERVALSMPLTVAVLLVFFLGWLLLPAAVIAWLLGYRFGLADKPAKAAAEKEQLHTTEARA